MKEGDREFITKYKNECVNENSLAKQLYLDEALTSRSDIHDLESSLTSPLDSFVTLNGLIIGSLDSSTGSDPLMCQ